MIRKLFSPRFSHLQCLYNLELSYFVLQLQFCLPGPVVMSAMSERTFKVWFFMQFRSLLQEHEGGSVQTKNFVVFCLLVLHLVLQSSFISSKLNLCKPVTQQNTRIFISKATLLAGRLPKCYFRHVNYCLWG